VRGWWAEAGLLGAFVGFTGLVATDRLNGLDLAVRDWADGHRPAAVEVVTHGLSLTGSANLIGVVVLVLTGVLARRWRTVRPLLLAVGTFAVSYVVVVPLKVLADRSAPHSPRPNAVELFANDIGWSYPSGHMVNAFIWYSLLVLVLERLRRRPLAGGVRRAIRVVPVVVIAITVTYLGFHWLTDTIAGLVLGLALERILRRVLWPVLVEPGGGTAATARSSVNVSSF
jgi:membrane-associated phospholipid phosphatase